MTTYSLPALPLIAGVNFKMDRVQGTNPSRSGEYQAVDLATPLWVAQIQTKELDRRTAGKYRSLFIKTRGAQRTVYVYDASAQVPQAFYGISDIGEWALCSSSELCSSTFILCSAVGGVHPWGTPKIESISASTGQMVLSGLEPGAELSEGDYGHWDDTPKRRLHCLIADVTAAADGTATITVEPPPPSAANVTFPVPFTMYRAAAEMVILASDLPFDTTSKWSAQFQARQILRRS